jgi:hypothetical protein
MNDHSALRTMDSADSADYHHCAASEYKKVLAVHKNFANLIPASSIKMEMDNNKIYPQVYVACDQPDFSVLKEEIGKMEATRRDHIIANVPVQEAPYNQRNEDRHD